MKLTFDHVHLHLGGREILRDVSFCVAKGSITALIGRNGAGKSSLIRCLTGEFSRYQGRILLDGVDARTLTPAQKARQLAYLPQQLPQPHVSVRELVSFGRSPYTPLDGRLSREDEAIVDRCLEATGMADFSHRLVDTLSGGERKKAFFAMVLAQDTPLVILDEPTAHLDTASRFEFLELAAKLGRETGKTFLVVLHDLPEVLRYTETMVVLHAGRVCFTGNAETCLAKNVPEQVFSIRITGNSKAGYAAVPLKTE